MLGKIKRIIIEVCFRSSYILYISDLQVFIGTFLNSWLFVIIVYFSKTKSWAVLIGCSAWTMYVTKLPLSATGLHLNILILLLYMLVCVYCDWLNKCVFSWCLLRWLVPLSIGNKKKKNWQYLHLSFLNNHNFFS